MLRKAKHIILRELGAPHHPVHLFFPAEQRQRLLETKVGGTRFLLVMVFEHGKPSVSSFKIFNFDRDMGGFLLNWGHPKIAGF